MFLQGNTESEEMDANSAREERVTDAGDMELDWVQEDYQEEKGLWFSPAIFVPTFALKTKRENTQAHGYVQHIKAFSRLQSAHCRIK